MTLENQRGKHRKYLPYAFTEQGVAMLSAVLRSQIAVSVSIQIINVFVQMRKLIGQTSMHYIKFDSIEKKLIEHDYKINKIFTAIEHKELPNKGIFFNGQIFDAWVFVSDLVKSAENEIILIDNFVDEAVLLLLDKRKNNVKASIYTKNISKSFALDIEKHNSQYQHITVKEFKDSHDRFMIIDQKELYHIGASLKDLGKKWFAFSKMNIDVLQLLGMLK